jgi:hypothetical protein
LDTIAMNTSPNSFSTPDQQRGLARLIADLDFVFQDPRWFTLPELLHLQRNFHQLVRHTYKGTAGTGCIFGLLTELRTGDGRIGCRESLTRFFTGGSGADYRELPVYQPARWIVRAWDMQACDRYSGVTLDRDTLRQALDRAIESRQFEEGRCPSAFLVSFLASP